jgi:hypothetical protein
VPIPLIMSRLDAWKVIRQSIGELRLPALSVLAE